MNNQIAQFKKNVRMAWCKETAYAADAIRWSKENPSCGQCAVTALLFQKTFGGTIRGGKVYANGKYIGWHYWNQLNETEYDLTKSQFRNLVEYQFRDIKTRTPASLMRAGNVEQRFLLLEERYNFSKRKKAA